MLEELHVHNFAIIDKLSVRFAPGLNILSGETGAGKSILVGALGLLLGDKTDTSIIRSGAEETTVSCVVSIGDNVEAAARGLGIEYTIEKVTDINEIMKFGVMLTPALVVDGVVKVAGKVPSVEELKKLLG